MGRRDKPSQPDDKGSKWRPQTSPTSVPLIRSASLTMCNDTMESSPKLAPCQTTNETNSKNFSHTTYHDTSSSVVAPFLFASVVSILFVLYVSLSVDIALTSELIHLHSWFYIHFLTSAIARLSRLKRPTRQNETSRESEQGGVVADPKQRIIAIRKEYITNSLRTVVRGRYEHVFESMDPAVQHSSPMTPCHRQKFSQSENTNEEAPTAPESTMSSKDSPCPTCLICFDDFVYGEDIGISQNAACLHRFHVRCIFEWLLKSQDCPCCRRDFFRNGTVYR
jgi:Ring finger domain